LDKKEQSVVILKPQRATSLVILCYSLFLAIFRNESASSEWGTNNHVVECVNAIRQLSVVFYSFDT